MLGAWLVEDELLLEEGLLVDGLVDEELLEDGLLADGLVADGLLEELLEDELLGAGLLGAGVVLPADGLVDEELEDELEGWSVDDLGALLASDPGALDEVPGWVPDEDGADVCAATPSARASVSTRLSKTAVGFNVMGHLLPGRRQQCKCQYSGRIGAHLRPRRAVSSPPSASLAYTIRPCADAPRACR